MATPLLSRILIYLIPLLILHSSHALSPPDSPLVLSTPLNASNTVGHTVPGRSPFVYMGNTNKYLLRLSFLDMSPNPCTLRSDCKLTARGSFRADVPAPRLLLNISSDFSGPPVPVFIIEDDLCQWVDVEQGGQPSCPPKQGPAILKFETLLLQGFIPEAKYGIDIQIKSKNAMVSHIYADLQLKDPIAMSS